jgi:hypothetical protein
MQEIYCGIEPPRAILLEHLEKIFYYVAKNRYCRSAQCG